MFSTQFLPQLIRHFKLTRLIGSEPFEFDSKSKKLILMKSRRRVRVFQLQSFLTFMYFLVLLYNFLFGQLSVLKRLQGVPFVVCYAVLVSIGWNVGLDVAPIQVINSILNFEKVAIQGMYISYRVLYFWHEVSFADYMLECLIFNPTKLGRLRRRRKIIKNFLRRRHKICRG